MKYISNIIPPKVSIAPMVDRTDRHFRYFCRLMTKKSLLYTEMITANSIIYGDRHKLLDFNYIEKPLSLQIAGCDPEEIYKAVKIAEDWDYNELNLNVGCPSDRISGNAMGAILMAYPELVADMVTAMREATKKPITVKHRIGINGNNVLPTSFRNIILDNYDYMKHFMQTIEKSKIDRFIIHARTAILSGLSPKENREIPPLRYDEVYKIKKDLPHLNIEINGGIKTIDAMKDHLKHVDGVMLGRVSYENSYILTKVDNLFMKGTTSHISRREILEKMLPYLEELQDNKIGMHLILRHTLTLFNNCEGSRYWKQLIDTSCKEGITAKNFIKHALDSLPEETLNSFV